MRTGNKHLLPLSAARLRVADFFLKPNFLRIQNRNIFLTTKKAAQGSFMVEAKKPNQILI